MTLADKLNYLEKGLTDILQLIKTHPFSFSAFLLGVIVGLIILSYAILAISVLFKTGINDIQNYPQIWKTALLRRQMHRVYLLLHFTRNNRSHTNYYYHRLLAIYPDGLPLTTRTDWEASRYDFDRQFGIVKALCENPEPAAVIKKADEDEIAELNKLCDELKTVREGLASELTQLDAFKTNVREIKQDLDSIQNSSKQIELANAIMKAINDSQQNP